ncbi:hypothetical protein CBM2586_A50396 [Cupriavidus phytorum]|uniref:Uncharacterized protein n=1 Tax=Cupriavidus taiwanensis TaxID=164546 RepID=A0A375C3P7_9BURK|nr:hypothetical protein CBM2586_A50396 [Cupriavidus taiwanensis]
MRRRGNLAGLVPVVTGRCRRRMAAFACLCAGGPEKKNGPDLPIQAVVSIGYFWSER